MDSLSKPMDSLSKPMDSLSKPMDSLSKPMDSLCIPYVYPRNYIDSDTDINSDTDTDAETAENLSSRFIRLWQQNADVFNCLARLKRPKDWTAFWEKNEMTAEQIDLAVGNFIAGVKSGAIERRFIPSSPDGFVLNGWIARSLDQFKKPDQRIANDSAADDEIDKYFRET
jgi:hypothetical protein